MLESNKVPSGYADAFRRADHTFLYQLVFDPTTQTQVHLNPLPSSVDVKELEYAGVYVIYTLFTCVCHFLF